MEDIEIARNTRLKQIREIANNLEISEDDIEQYGKYKAKISLDIYKKLENKQEGKLILVTAINPTPLGEGKTTASIGIADGLRKVGQKSIVVLREPSLGPVFGMKGGATGGGYSQVAPMEDINLHFTGDIHAITSANNLLSAIIDNHIYNGNELGFKKVTWKRCIDLNDRQLRKVNTGLSGQRNIKSREDGFDITVASEIMAIFCLATDLKDLQRRIGNIIVGYNNIEEPITAKDLNAQGALTVLLKDAINPNLVQTLEHTPALIHGGPFANIAHGCNSIIATKLALKLADYTVTEAGFGADLGAEKFLDIKCRKLKKMPDVVVLVATIRALKYHGGMPKEYIEKEDMKFLNRGMKNLFKHISNLKNEFGMNVIVAINKFDTDTENEINFINEELKKEEVQISLLENWSCGGKGAVNLAQKIVQICKNTPIKESKYIYKLEDPIKEKIEKIATKIYNADKVEYSEKSIEQIKKIEKMEYWKLPICIAKTQYSLSDNAKNIEDKEPYNLHIEDVELKAGAEFIVVKTGKIMTMPGLPKHPAAENIGIDESSNIIGIF